MEPQIFQTQPGQFMMNPLSKKLSKIKDADNTAATYKGILAKCLFFMTMVLVGAVIAFILPTIPYNGIYDSRGVFFSYLVIGGAIASILLFGLGSLVAMFAPMTAPVAGSLSCIGSGYLLAFMATVFPDIRGIMLLAFLLTFSLVLSMQFLYSSGKVRVTQKFRTVVSVLFLTSILGSLLIGICSFIPATSDIIPFLQGNMLISIGFSILGIIVATLFLLVDFDTIHKLVEYQRPKKYEWIAAFSLSFTVIWLYFKILDLLSYIFGRD